MRYEAAAPDGTTVCWEDPRRRWWLLALVMPLLPALSIWLAAATGFGAFWFLGAFVTFGLIPTADLLFGDDGTNPPEAVVVDVEADPWYRAIVLAFVPMAYVVWFGSLWYVGTADPSWIATLGIAVNLGIMGGTGINAAHELGHKREELEHWASKLALAPVAYGHFFVEHNWGHHKMVATPEDPASARMGESYYRFWPGVVAGSVRSAWAIERRRLRARGWRVLSPRNRVLHAWSLTVLLWGTALVVFGWRVLPVLVIQAVVGFSLLETVNYIEHYGLLRRRLESGRYERTTPAHSWNNDHVVSNLFLYQLQRHSDHHANPSRRFQVLRHFDDSPQLPAGYAAMILLALLPPLWRRTMDPLVLAHYDGDLSRVNLRRDGRVHVPELERPAPARTRPPPRPEQRPASLNAAPASAVRPDRPPER